MRARLETQHGTAEVAVVELPRSAEASPVVVLWEGRSFLWHRDEPGLFERDPGLPRGLVRNRPIPRRLNEKTPPAGFRWGGGLD